MDKMQYRILEPLRYYETNRRIEAGTIDDLKNLSPKSIAMLLAKGRIAEVVAPPLVALPGFVEKAGEYAKQGILSVNDMTGEEDDFEEALEWSAGCDDQNFLERPIGAMVYELEVLKDEDNGDDLD